MSCCKDLEHRLEVTLYARETRPIGGCVLQIKVFSHWDTRRQDLDFSTRNAMDMSKHISELKVLHVCDNLGLFKLRRGIVSED